jgi:hypothetical protein
VSVVYSSILLSLGLIDIFYIAKARDDLPGSAHSLGPIIIASFIAHLYYCFYTHHTAILAAAAAHGTVPQ